MAPGQGFFHLVRFLTYKFYVQHFLSLFFEPIARRNRYRSRADETSAKKNGKSIIAATLTGRALSPKEPMTIRDLEPDSLSNDKGGCVENDANGRISFGRFGETIARQFLIDNGWKIVEQNWRPGRFGEIDIIARDLDDSLVFLEVKTRITAEDDKDIDGFSAVHGLKQRKVVNAALRYLKDKQLSEEEVVCRFDVIVVQCQKSLEKPDILHVRDAFHGYGWA